MTELKITRNTVSKRGDERANPHVSHPGATRCVEVLYDFARDVTPDDKGGTALLYAAAQGHLATVNFLLDKCDELFNDVSDGIDRGERYMQECASSGDPVDPRYLDYVTHADNPDGTRYIATRPR